MGRAPCCDKANVKKGPWSPEEDLKLKEYIEKHGTGGNWIALPHKAGLKRCGKSCRLRWLNYLRPNLKHGEFSDDEDRIICSLFASIGSRWSIIAAQLPGRTDNDIKNYWNTKLKKKLLGLLPSHQRKPLHDHYHQPQLPSPFGSSSSTSSATTSTTHHMTMMMNTCNNLISTIAASPKNPTSPFALIDDDIHIPTCHEQLILPFQTHYEYCFPTYLSEFQSKPSLLMFGGSEQSCTSSDASGSTATTTTTNYNIPTAYHMDLPGSTSNFCTSSSSTTTLRSYGLFDEDNQKNLTNSGAGGGDDGGATGLWPSESTPMLEYYSIEEIKQLINSSSTSSGCNNVLPHFLNINDGNVINRGMNSNPRGDSCTSETVIS